MSYKATFDGMQIEADTIEELNQLLGLMEQRKGKQAKKEEKEAEHVEKVMKALDVMATNPAVEIEKPKKPKRSQNWEEEHFRFLYNNLENREVLRALPFRSAAISGKVWAFKNNRWADLSKTGQRMLEEYNDCIGRITPKERLPKIKEL